ncbi:motility associated factor glycosyltransferase family protein [Lysinibacillus sp. NPDC096418]|uniref:motility associated factor glycosyltransferase family protein n=1 Tax=Lysinibacillus sp. NPDC096418 TaxID=3364138 RepID=UPI00382823D4
MDVRIEREISKIGIETVKVNDLYLHSKYNPLNEAERFLGNEYKPHHLHIVFGYGLGYIVETLIEKMHFNEPILVLDPLVDDQQLHIVSTTYKRLYNANLNNIADVVSMIDQLSSYSTNVHVITSINYDKLFPRQLKNVLELVKNNHFKQGSNMATAKHFANSWQRNLLLNTQNIKNDASLESLKEIYNTPVVIASGGPSLTKQLKLLKENRERVILICAGSTINALLANDIMPDYIVSVDGGEPNAQHFEELKFNKDVSLIYGPTNHNNVRKSFEGNCYGFIPSVKPQYQQYFKKRFSKSLPLIDGGGSVAHYALSIAKYITTGPIALIGQDLALTNDQSHASGVKGNHNTTKLSEDKKFYVEGYYGEQVVTTQTLRIMLNSYNEPPLLDTERRNIWNCTEGGAKIQSISQLPFAEFIKQFLNETVVKVEQVENKNLANNLDEFLQKEIENYIKILKLLNKGIQVIEKSVGQKLTKDELNRIGKIEKEVNSLYKKYCMETLLEPIFDRCSHEYLPKVNETELESNIRAKKYALDLYTSSVKQIEQFIEQLNLKGND